MCVMEMRNPNSWPARAPRMCPHDGKYRAYNCECWVCAQQRPGLFRRLWQDESAPIFGLVIRTAWLWWPLGLVIGLLFIAGRY